VSKTSVLLYMWQVLVRLHMWLLLVRLHMWQLLVRRKRFAPEHIAPVEVRTAGQEVPPQTAAGEALCSLELAAWCPETKINTRVDFAKP